MLPQAPGPECITIGARLVPLWFIRHRRARRYILRVQRDGSARVTIPRGGSQAEARAFAERHATWIERQWLKKQVQIQAPATWRPGTEVLFRGELARISLSSDGAAIQLGGEVIPRVSGNDDLRPMIEGHLRNRAVSELEVRARVLAGQWQLAVRRVTVRNQRSRWGSCSAKGTLSLNWRLIQTPDWVRDYIIVHELMHLREMNHSARFWRLVAQASPQYAEAEAWLKKHAALLRSR